MKKFLLTAVMLGVGVCFLGCEPAKKEAPKAAAPAAEKKDAPAAAAPAAPAAAAPAAPAEKK